MSTLVDSNILIDLVHPGSAWQDWSRNAVITAKSHGDLVLNQIILSEIAIEFETFDDLEDAWPKGLFKRETFPFEAAFTAGHAHLKYRKNGGERERTLPDFLIGAHAQIKGHLLLTRDPRRYRAYFDNLEIIAPDTHP